MTTQPRIPQPQTERRRRVPRDIPRFVVLSLLALLFLAPIYWMLSTSFKPESDTISLPIQWWPKNFTLENYREILTSPDGNIGRWTLNSVFTSVAYTLSHLLLCVLAAYPLARMKFPGRDAWFWFVISSMMVPGIVTLIPSYIMMIQLNWIDTYHALIWPGVSGAFGVFLLRQFFMSIPGELEEAAVLDGANSWVILWKVIVPLSVPVLVTLGVFSFMGSWNNYVWPLFVVHGDMQTLPVGITSFSSRYTTDYGKLMAGTAIASIPVLVAYLIGQRYLEQGLSAGGSKE
ncbi:carbohydrate ABC transporter permease [Deinococcus cellulosilyticus]|uniref:ABC transporter permease n=1 Tax=Deinococcus cellulosilyticus (strain DSM 18568 / NBRC 106333 / KACC 11606 / 5516J-15) TaxID=1223518 RepID=A0A511N0X4_DEIC1|nr:carbohydrate ABC transporter permease [Deinococcus cellulosilyticus]GEM46036.1 ABC transporter permease [Deinococcus cellulosilyticus NBRC 106333 = KACC 11606]